MITIKAPQAARAATFQGLDPQRKADLLAHLTGLDAKTQARVITAIRTAGGPEADFIAHLLAPATAPAPAPAKP